MPVSSISRRKTRLNGKERGTTLRFSEVIKCFSLSSHETLMKMNVTEALKILALQLSHFSPPPSSIAAVTSGDDTVLLTPGRMSQRQVKERDKEKEKEKEKEAGLQTPNREHIATPSNLSPGVSYSHGELLVMPYVTPSLLCFL